MKLLDLYSVFSALQFFAGCDIVSKSKEEGKDQKSIQSSTAHASTHHMGNSPAVFR